MPLPEKAKPHEILLRFGAGLNTRASPQDIDPSECADGQNYGLALGDKKFFRRPPFDLAGTATNGGPIRGFAQLEKADDTFSTVVQAANVLYEWDGIDSFTQIGTVDASARIRGANQQNWPLGTPVVIITDLAEREPVFTWDGTNKTVLAHGLSDDFYARYCNVENDRAYYANIKAGTSTPHLLVASAREDYTDIAVTGDSARGSASSIGAGDAFWLTAPDLKYVNGMTTAFGLLVFSTRRGRIYKFTGSDSTDALIKVLFPDSGATGDQPIVYIGNDFAYGRPAGIETLFASEKLGDVGVDDLTRHIAPSVSEADGWDLYYLSRFQKVYCFPDNEDVLYVLHKDFIDEDIRRVAERTDPGRLSPWSPWATDHALAYRPTATMVMRDPRDGLENVFMGDSNGSIYRLEGTGGQDGGTTDIKTERLSQLLTFPPGTEFDVSGKINYRKTGAGTVTLTFEHSGQSIFDQPITVNIESPDSFPVFGEGGATTYYFGAADTYFGIKFEKRLTRQIFNTAGKADELQVRVTNTSGVELVIDSIYMQFKSLGP